jgi:hypothetical protein
MNPKGKTDEAEKHQTHLATTKWKNFPETAEAEKH